MRQNTSSRRSALLTTKNDLQTTAAEEAHQKKQTAKRHAKRKKPRWKERVSPAPAAESKEQVVDEETLTKCTRCPAHRNRSGKFRPLIGTGEYLCDDCYQREFPATAMLDDVGDSALHRMGKRASNVVLNAGQDMMADILGKTSADEAIQKTNEDDYPSEIECRQCLEKAIFRRCCSSYYCHSCYHKNGRCPGCNIETNLTGVAAADRKFDPGKVAVGLSWALSFLIILVSAIGLALAYFNASTTPTTVWGHTCRGWFPVCDLAVCVDYDGAVGYGEVGGFLPAAQPYKVCDRELTATQVVGSACVYDRALYTWSNQLLGYDICTSSPREEKSRARNVSSPDPLLLLSNNESGVYTFDDDFERPTREASAPWSEIINGNRSTACGVNSQFVERGNHGGFKPVENVNALVFTGVHKRQATTAGLNVGHGGRVEFFLKMGPLATGNTVSECKTAFSDISLEYSISDGEEWTTFGTYPAWKYRGEEFQFISQDIPKNAWSNSTQFRFRQASFDVLRDHWALDDIRIMAHLKPKWQESEEFQERKEQQNFDVKLSQCCYHTSQCSVFDQKKMNFDQGRCDSVPGFDKSKRSSRLQLGELLILYLGLAAGAKVLYRLAVLRFTNRVAKMKREQLKDTTDSSQPPDAELFPRHSFQAKTHLSWQNGLALVLVLALVAVFYRLLDSLVVSKCMAQHESCTKTNASFVIACMFAAIFDVRAIGVIVGEVLCIECPWRKRLEVVVDLHPDRGFMRVGSKTIPLSQVSEVKTQSTFFCGFLSLCYVFGGLPFALASLTLQSFDLPNGLGMSAMLGCVALLREIFGPSIFVKLCLSITWLLARKQRDRDEMGRSILRKGLLQQTLIGSTLTPCLIMFSLLGRRVEYVGSLDNFLLFLVCVFLGGLFGVVLGVMHGLPTTSEAKLTCWPGKCCSVSYYDQVDCPCLFSCTYCGEMHSSQKLLVVALDDMYAFKRMLQGNPNQLPSG